MNQRPPIQHPLAPLFQRAAQSLTTHLNPGAIRLYYCTIRNFLNFLDTQYPQVQTLSQLRRDPHILDWLTGLRSRQPPLATITYTAHLTHLRCMLEELAWSEDIPALARIILRQDTPRPKRYLPRPLTAEQDVLVQQELLRRNDRYSNALLLIRHTGMRIGECVDLSFDCLRMVAPHGWAIHVPLGKLKTERVVPVDSFVCRLVERLRVLRSQDPLPADGFLLSRPASRDALLYNLRTFFRGVVASSGITTRIVPHQLRHSYGTEMVRFGVSLLAVMKLLGHLKAEMTMRYVEVSAIDLRRELDLALSQPRHPIPESPLPASVNPPQASLASLLDSLRVAQHVLEMFRRTLPQGPDRRLLDHLANRLTKIASETRKLGQG
jgi:integrase